MLFVSIGVSISRNPFLSKKSLATFEKKVWNKRANLYNNKGIWKCYDNDPDYVEPCPPSDILPMYSHPRPPSDVYSFKTGTFKVIKWLHKKFDIDKFKNIV